METVNSAGDDRTVNNTSAVRHNFRVLNDDEKAAMVAMKDKGQEFIDLCNSHPKTREMSIAITNAEQAVMWAVKAITA